MKVSMPSGTGHGWGIAGSYLRHELAQLPQLPDVTLHCISGHDFRPFDVSRWNRINIGYCFFEHELLAAPFMEEASKRWDHIVAGSHWCEQQLRFGGVSRVSTILQGVDSVRFAAQPSRTTDGRFILFSGGKFEFRKGQDIVIAALRQFMQRHQDVWLSCAWHNGWPQSLRTMEQSRLIQFDWRPDAAEELVRETIERNGLDAGRVMLHPAFGNDRMPLIYAESDLGLFPNRCEGGTNMVMCEYMACGRAVIASDRTGQADVVTDSIGWPLTAYQPIEVLNEGMVTGRWQEAQVGDLLEKLEMAYADPAARQRKALHAAAAMQGLSWKKAAHQFYELGQRILTERGAVVATVLNSALQGIDAADRLFDAGEYDEAYHAYAGLLQKRPLDADLHNRIGTALDRLGRYSEAVVYYQKSLYLNPQMVIARYNLANTLRHLGDDNGAEENLLLTLQNDPGFAEAWKSLAMLQIARDAYNDAAESFEKLIQLVPADIENRCALGVIYGELGRFQEAVACFDALLAQDPDHLLALESLGTVLHELDELGRAEMCYRKVLEVEPNSVSVINNLGTVLRSQNRLEEAVSLFNCALEILPENGQVRFNRGVARLALNELPDAWDDYEARFETNNPPRLRHTELPRWQGEPLGGKGLLVQSEQGFGDTFQFARYLPLLSARVDGPVVYECWNNSVLQALNGLEGVQVLAQGDPLPDVACQIPLASLPCLFQAELSSIPSPEGYLKASPAAITFWQQCLSDTAELRVGIVWGGNKNSLNANRSLQLSQLSSLLNLPGIKWYSLQVGPDAGQLQLQKKQITDLGSRIRHFGDTAAIISCLDLVLTIDSAVAHLAGALGMPVWIMLKYAPDWRWLLGRSDSPWYHSAVLFRQPRIGDWNAVVTEVGEKLLQMLDDQKKRVKVYSRSDE